MRIQTYPMTQMKDYQIRQTLEEGWKLYRSKYCNHHHHHHHQVMLTARIPLILSCNPSLSAITLDKSSTWYLVFA